MGQTKIIRPDGSEVFLEFEKDWGDIGRLCENHGQKFYTSKGWYTVRDEVCGKWNEAVHELFLEERKILLWRVCLFREEDDMSFYLGIKGLKKISGETREEVERKLKLLAFE